MIIKWLFTMTCVILFFSGVIGIAMVFCAIMRLKKHLEENKIEEER